MLESLCVLFGSYLVIALFYFGLQFLTLAIYRRLFGLLYRNVSEEYADPVSFWVAMSLPLSLICWIVYLYIQFTFR
jgi:hypothetical protein